MLFDFVTTLVATGTPYSHTYSSLIVSEVTLLPNKSMLSVTRGCSSVTLVTPQIFSPSGAVVIPYSFFDICGVIIVTELPKMSSLSLVEVLSAIFTK